MAIAPLVAGLAIAVPIPAQAEVRAPAVEPLAAPVGGVFWFEGRGAGHGRGMSQWGAEGAASHGVGYRRILSTYYPGTRLVRTKADPPIRVLLSRVGSDLVQVAAVPGLQLTTGRRTATLPQAVGRAVVRGWRVRPSGRSLVLEDFTNRWRVHAVAGRLELRAPEAVRVTVAGGSREYRGALQVLPTERPGQLQVVNVVDVEDYLRSVVPSESMAGWAPAALAAQAVAARTWAHWRAEHAPAPAVSDVCDTAACQMYPGYRTLDAAGRVDQVFEDPRTDRAVAATRGAELTWHGRPAFTEYSASDGGWTAAGGLPYLPARRDPWDGLAANPAHSWTDSVPAEVIRAWWPAVGRPLGLAAQRRDGTGPWGGRVLTVRIVGDRGQVLVPANQFAARTGLSATWWQLRGATGLPRPRTRHHG
ncbi:MAG TPA: SpoIID/LytB domain-containing protein [Sporichthyaceae bacterium]|nr:SpoIID/LytB domain-containing protein [Sporichthyaceae bacterium]